MAALTHYTESVTPEEYGQIMAETAALVSTITDPFHMIIDNRNIAGETKTPLSMMQQATPFASHELLVWIVVVLPEREDASSQPVQHGNHVRLIYVNSLSDAFNHLNEEDSTLELDDSHAAFFA